MVDLLGGKKPPDDQKTIVFEACNLIGIKHWAVTLTTVS